MDTPSTPTGGTLDELFTDEPPVPEEITLAGTHAEPWALADEPAPVAALWSDDGPVKGPWRRRLPLVGLIIILVAAVVASGIFYLNGAQWRDRASEKDAQLTTVQSNFDALTKKNAAALKDTATLEKRIDELSTEKAQAEDAQQFATVQRDKVIDVATSAGTVSSQLSQCIDSLANARDILTKISNGETYDTAQLKTFSDKMSALCTDAQTRNTTLQGLLTDLIAQLKATPAPATPTQPSTTPSTTPPGQ